MKHAQELLDKAKEDLAETQARSVLSLDDDSLSKMNRSDLIFAIKTLHSKIEQLEEKKVQSEFELLKSKMAVKQTLMQLACGGAAGAIARTSVAPIDRVKILMQTSHLTGTEGKYKSVLGTFRRIIQDEGAGRLWRGNFTNCIRVVPHTATQFVSYEKYKKFFVEEGQGMSAHKRLMAGALSGMTAATVTHPMDVVRIRLQTQPELKGIADSVRSVYAENGLRTFYKGYTPALLSLSPFIAINFATFDTLKTYVYGDVQMSKKELQARNPFTILGLGAASGLFAQTCCYPLDTVRRRMQLKGTNYSSTVNAFSTILKDEGFLGFYKGMTANALKVVPNNAIRFAAYEMLKSFLIEQDEEKRDLQTWKSMSEDKRKKTIAV